MDDVIRFFASAAIVVLAVCLCLFFDKVTEGKNEKRIKMIRRQENLVVDILKKDRGKK